MEISSNSGSFSPAETCGHLVRSGDTIVNWFSKYPFNEDVPGIDKSKQPVQLYCTDSGIPRCNRDSMDLGVKSEKEVAYIIVTVNLLVKGRRLICVEKVCMYLY